MLINVAQLLKEPTGSTRIYQVDELAGENGEIPSEGEVTLTRTNLGILVTGKIRAKTKDICVRCLEPAERWINFDIEDEYLPTLDISTDRSLTIETDNPTIDSNHVIDLIEAIRQYIIIYTPTKLLCRPNCAGMCPICGYNLNQGTCQCSPQSGNRPKSKLVRTGKEN